jgi:hypothetical protein
MVVGDRDLAVWHFSFKKHYRYGVKSSLSLEDGEKFVFYKDGSKLASWSLCSDPITRVIVER